MPNPGISRAVAENTVRAIEQVLAEGYVLQGKPSAAQELARRLQIPDGTIRQRLRAALRQWGIAPVPPGAAPPETVEPVVVGDAAKASDPIDVRRLREQISGLAGRLKAAEIRAAEAEDIRAGVLGLLKEPLRPRVSIITRPQSSAGKSQAAILHISDVHGGEVISSPEILGSNKYNIDIFRARLSRLFRTACELCTSHWPRSDAEPVELVICLGGDLLSGSIHPELSETNTGTDYQLVREIAERVAGGIAMLRANTSLPIRVFSVPGNHGRTTEKPRAKRQGLMSWDIVIADMAESALRGDANIKWFRSEGTDCYFDVVGWPILLTHGHAMGTKSGGQGFIGPMAPIMRGHRKTVDTEYRQRRPVYLVLSGHFHTTSITPFGVANGSVVGYGEYSRQLRADPEPAKQNFLVLQESHGLIRWQPIYLGVPEEGSLYQGFAGWAGLHQPQECGPE